MASNEIREIVRRWFLVELMDDAAEDDLPDDLDLRDNGILDSLSTLQLVGFVEERFGIDVAVDEAGPSNFGNISLIVSYIDQKTKGMS